MKEERRLTTEHTETTEMGGLKGLTEGNRGKERSMRRIGAWGVVVGMLVMAASGAWATSHES